MAKAKSYTLLTVRGCNSPLLIDTPIILHGIDGFVLSEHIAMCCFCQEEKSISLEDTP
jgi:hypothetical protein